MKLQPYKRRSAAHVKVPLATPEIIELNETTNAPFSIREYQMTSSPMSDTNRDDLINSSSSAVHDSVIEGSITDSSKQTRGRPTRLVGSFIGMHSDDCSDGLVCGQLE